MQQKRLQWLPTSAKLLQARMNTKYVRDQQACDRQYHSSMEPYRHGYIQRRVPFNVVLLILKESR
jgi:hypothetical protein